MVPLSKGLSYRNCDYCIVAGIVVAMVTDGRAAFSMSAVQSFVVGYVH